MANVKEEVKNLFKANGAYKTLHAFSDGNIFSDINFAKNHQRSCRKDYVTYHREDFNYSEQEAVNTKKGGKVNPLNKVEPPKTSLEDQLKSIDLEKCEGKDYQTLKQLRDGLNIKTEDNKFPTILEALKKAKLEMTNKSTE